MPKQSSGNWRKRRFPMRKKLAVPKKTSDEVARPEKLPVRSAAGTALPTFPAAPTGRQASRITLSPSQSIPHHSSSPSKILNAAFAAVNTRNQRKYGGGKAAGETSDALEEWRCRNGMKPKIMPSATEREDKERWAYSPEEPSTTSVTAEGPDWLVDALSGQSAQAPLSIQSSPPRSLAPIGNIGTTTKTPFSDPGVTSVRYNRRPPTPVSSVPGFLGGNLLAHHSSQTAQTGLPFTPPTPAASLTGLAHKPFAQPASGILRRNSSAIFTEDETVDWESALQRPSRSVTFDLPNFLSEISAGQKGDESIGRGPHPRPVFSSSAYDLDSDTSLAEEWAAQELGKTATSLSMADDARTNEARIASSRDDSLQDSMLFSQPLPASDVWTQEPRYADTNDCGPYDWERPLTPDLDFAPSHESDFIEEAIYDHASDIGEHW